MNNFTIVNNLIIKEIGLNLHDTDTKSHAYREYLQQLGLYMALDLANRGILPTKKVKTITPLGELNETIVDDTKIGIINVLRAGTNMSMGVGDAFPDCSIVFVSAWRKTIKGKTVALTDYTRGMEALKNKFVIIADPALATGCSLLACIDICKKYIDTKNTVILSLHAAKEGIENIHKEYPEIRIYSVFGPNKLNEDFYIKNGPGDCGDRCFNT
ncbi:MAG: uracil phosphoribosyltransferase [Candidatus Dojkabacteria bacterium]|jgi:uracil phosphoribosyltransferase